jgi:Do/DeqQ family serine protease
MKRTTILILIIFLVAFLGGILGSILTFRYIDSTIPYQSIEERQNLVQANYLPDTAYRAPREMNFLSPASEVVASVVHIQVSYGPGSFSVNPFGNYSEPTTNSSGSGVIVTDDGFIITNYHVIEDATNIEVVLNNNQRFFAKIIGTDPTTDLALLKIKSKNLPFLRYGDSDNVKLGEWVLAVGNPFDLNSTVTAGIVSARARNIRILAENNPLSVESFIQTDAAVNPGNSGGALVNLRGELIGINSAIATATGGYAGYSFAIPSSLVKKVMDDLLEYGQVQRGLLGVQILNVDAYIAEHLKLKINQGVLIDKVNKGSAAEESRMATGDVITAINDHPIRSVSELQELVARYRPGKEIYVQLIRDGEEVRVKARLKDFNGNEEVVKRETLNKFNGLIIGEVHYDDLANLKIEGGVQVTGLEDGKWVKTGIKKGFIIAFIDRVPVENVQDFNRILEYKRGGILIEGFYPSGEKGTYGLDW